MKVMYQKPVAEFINLANEDVLTDNSGSCWLGYSTWERDYKKDVCTRYGLQSKVGGIEKCRYWGVTDIGGVFSSDGEQW